MGDGRRIEETQQETERKLREDVEKGRRSSQRYIILDVTTCVVSETAGSIRHANAILAKDSSQGHMVSFKLVCVLLPSNCIRHT